jgi:hypothetical protein
MAYIGKTPTVGNFQVCDSISVVNGQAAYTLQVGGANVIPESANHMLVSLNGILQKPGSSFTVSSSTMTFASNLATGDVIDFVQILGNVLDIGQPSDSSVTGAKLASDIGISTTGNIATTSSGTMTSAGLITASSGVAIGGTGAANTLDDYEEGLHTPTLTDTAGDVTSIALNSSYNQLAYTKIGRLVHISGTLVISSFSGSWQSDGTLRMTLPFTTADLTDQGAKTTMSLGSYNVDFTAGTSPYIQAKENDTAADFFVSEDNGGGGKFQPSSSGQLYIGGFFIAA